jgi:hypothetical protein
MPDKLTERRCIMKSTYTWRFPSIIGLFAVPRYLRILDHAFDIDTVIFDMTRTTDIHSAFIGFLILAMERLNMEGKKLEFRMSPYIRKTITMHGMNDYFNRNE